MRRLLRVVRFVLFCCGIGLTSVIAVHLQVVVVGNGCRSCWSWAGWVYQGLRDWGVGAGANLPRASPLGGGSCDCSYLKLTPGATIKSVSYPWSSSLTARRILYSPRRWLSILRWQSPPSWWTLGLRVRRWRREGITFCRGFRRALIFIIKAIPSSVRGSRHRCGQGGVGITEARGQIEF